MSKKLTLEKIINRFKERYGDFYDYSKVNYINIDTPIIITCPYHGQFFKTPYNFLKGQECEYCLEFEAMKKKGVKKYGTKFDYSKAKPFYFGNKVKVPIICSNHGMINITFSQHLRKEGCGCYKCGKEKAIKKRNERYAEKYKEKIIKKYGDKFDLSRLEYKGSKEKVIIICKKCGKIMERSPFTKFRCSDCSAKEKAKTAEQFITDAKKVHGESYDYSLINYINAKTPVKIICKRCKEQFYQTPNNHLKGKGCSCCKKYKGEEKINIWLKTNNIAKERNKKFDNLKDKNKLSYDFFIESKNIAIEYNGIQHYEFTSIYHKNLHDFHKQLHHDWLKRKYARDNEIKIVIIPYWEYNNIEKILKENFLTK